MTGSRGPLPKPAALKALEGNPGKRSLNLSDGVNPRVEVPSAPQHLGKEAKKEWKRITPLLEDLGLISGLDRTALAIYCQVIGRLFELEEAFNGKIKAHQASGKDYSDAVYAASFVTTPNGFEQQSVIFQLIRSHREQANRQLMHFGLSPAARARVQPSNYVQPSLPGMEPDQTKAPVGFAQFAARAPLMQ